MAVCGLSLYQGSTESRKTLEQKIVFQIDTLNPYGSCRGSNSPWELNPNLRNSYVARALCISLLQSSWLLIA